MTHQIDNYGRCSNCGLRAEEFGNGSGCVASAKPIRMQQHVGPITPDTKESVATILGDFAVEIINYDKRMNDAGAPQVRFVGKYIKKYEKRLKTLRQLTQSEHNELEMYRRQASAKEPVDGGDELLKGLADIIGCEWSSDENGFEGYDWFYVEPETGARFAMGEGANQLAELKNFVQAHTDAAVREAENIARLAEQANTRADTNGNVWYRADIDSGTEVTQLERIDQLLAESDSDYATFLARLTKDGN